MVSNKKTELPFFILFTHKIPIKFLTNKPHFFIRWAQALTIGQNCPRLTLTSVFAFH